MKKTIIVLITAFLFTFTAFAQEEENHQKNTTTFGIKGGVSFNTIRGDDGFASTDFYASFFSTTRLSEKWSFQNELGVSIIDDVTFIEVPLLFKYHITDKWSIFAGPRLDFRASKSFDTMLIDQDGGS